MMPNDTCNSDRPMPVSGQIQHLGSVVDDVGSTCLVLGVVLLGIIAITATLLHLLRY